MQTLNQIIESAWNETISDLTPEEKKVVMNSSPKDWSNAISDCLKSPSFWSTIGVAFVEGIAQGISDYLSDR